MERILEGLTQVEEDPGNGHIQEQGIDEAHLGAREEVAEEEQRGHEKRDLIERPGGTEGSDPWRCSLGTHSKMRVRMGKGCKG